MTKSLQEYTVQIDELQRKIIIAALEQHAIKLSYERTEYAQSDADECEALVDCLKELPEIEAQEPNIVHGLCY